MTTRLQRLRIFLTWNSWMFYGWTTTISLQSRYEFKGVLLSEGHTKRGNARIVSLLSCVWAQNFFFLPYTIQTRNNSFFLCSIAYTYFTVSVSIISLTDVHVLVSSLSVNICYIPVEGVHKKLCEITGPQVLSKAQGQLQRAVLKTKASVLSQTDWPRLVDNLLTHFFWFALVDQGLANQIQGFKILTCCDASEKIRSNCIFFV